jgi:hypothetical protein
VVLVVACHLLDDGVTVRFKDDEVAEKIENAFLLLFVLFCPKATEKMLSRGYGKAESITAATSVG